MRPATQSCRPSNTLVTFAAVFISNSQHPAGVKLVETLIIYENKTHVSANCRRSAQLDYNCCFCAHAWLANDGTISDDAVSTTFCAKDDDGDASVL